jgi:hypothetical protein
MVGKPGSSDDTNEPSEPHRSREEPARVANSLFRGQEKRRMREKVSQIGDPNSDAFERSVTDAEVPNVYRNERS